MYQRCRFLLLCFVVTSFFNSQLVFGQPDVLNDALPFSGATLSLRMYADPGSDDRLNSITTQPASTGNSNIFLSTQEGRVYEISPDGSGQGNSNLWFDYNVGLDQAFANTDGYELSGSGGQNGLQGIAFHPEFSTNGKFYTSALINNENDVQGFNYLGNSAEDGEVIEEGVVAEWTFNSTTGEVDGSSYRELFRIRLPDADHPIKLVQFDPFAQPGDENYGLLFLAQGDGDSQNRGGVEYGRARDTQNALGKFLRFNPLEDTVNNTPYSVPGTNPFVTDPNNPLVNDGDELEEIYTRGHRNPHTYSFAQDDQGNSHILVGEIGFENIEEINLLQAGGDFGWTDRQGTFDTVEGQRNYGLMTPDNPNGGLLPLPSNDAALNDYIYPVAQYDHSFQGSGQAVAGGVVIDNDSDPSLQGQYIFADFSLSTGHVYQTTFADMLNAKTQLADDELPSDLTQAVVSRLRLTIDEDGDGDIDASGNSLQDVLSGLPGNGRTDVRFGQGVNGELYITSKQTGNVYLVTNTLVGSEGVEVVEPVGQQLITWSPSVDLLTGAGSPDSELFVNTNGIEGVFAINATTDANTLPNGDGEVPDAGPSPTVNGVTFVGTSDQSLAMGVTQNGVTLTISGTGGSTQGAFNAGSFTGDPANDLLEGGLFNLSNVEFVFSGLTAGATYEVQFFVNDSRGSRNNGVGLGFSDGINDLATSQSIGTAGFADANNFAFNGEQSGDSITGSFTPVDTAQSFTIAGTNNGGNSFGAGSPSAFNALQLRLISNPVGVLLGDVNLDGDVNFLDIAPFIARLSDGEFQVEADMDQDGDVDFLDISPFITALTSQ